LLDAEAFLQELAQRSRVIVIGGIAVVLHGFQRVTADADIWLEPGPNTSDWAKRLSQPLARYQLSPAKPRGTAASFETVPMADIEGTVEHGRFIRVLGLDRPVDVFRTPNNFETEDFDAVWKHSSELSGGLRLMDEVDLIVTKMNTGRAHDEADMRFLQNKTEQAYRQRLQSCSAEEGAEMLERLPLATLAAFATREAQDETVRLMGRNLLNELCRDGDAYAKELLEEIERHDDARS
jgi:hypothetical protein